MDKVGLAGTIGTWAAVFLALLALVGVVGPILVWRASRTERQIALQAVDAALAENGGFLTKGIKIWPGIRLFRRVRAPLLRAEPVLSLTPIDWSSNVRQVSKSSMSWVKFGLLVRSYGLKYETGDSLTIADSQTLLPVNKVWILVIGLLGRFGHRKDKGKLSKKQVRGVISTQAVPGRGLPLPEALFRDNSMFGSRFEDLEWAGSERRNRHAEQVHLHGLTGTLTMSRYHPSDIFQPVRFVAHKPDEVGNLVREKLSIDGLFWLAVGCIPSANGRVFSLENAQMVTIEVELDEEGDDVLLQTQRPTYRRYRRTRSEDEEDGVDWSDDPRHESEDRLRNLSNTYVQNEAPTRIPRGVSGARAFQFSPTDERVESLQGIARILQVERTNPVVMSLEEIPVSNDERADLEHLSASTYIPSDYRWVRLPRSPPPSGRRNRSRERRRSQDLESTWYLQRPDAQLLAQSLLRLPICNKGYLFNINKSSLCYRLLCSAAPNAPRLIFYMISHFDALQIPEASRQSLLLAMDETYRRMQKAQSSRAFMHAIYEMDMALQRVSPLDEKIVEAIGVLTITNEEIRDLINLSVRRIPQLIDQSVKLDLSDPAIVVKAVLGAEQRFPVDLAALFPGFVASQGVVELSFTSLILLVLKASLRSAFLMTSLDSLPLFEQVMKMEDVVHIG